MIAATAYGLDLGLPTFIAGLATTFVILTIKHGGAVEIVKDISWSVLLLVAGLFVLVEALQQTGAIKLLAAQLGQVAQSSPDGAAWTSGVLVAILCNAVNNLPAGLIAGAAIQAADVSDKIAGAILIGIDLGPNLSVTGSLATILWLNAIMREGEIVSFWRFLKLGLLVTPPALILALAGLLLFQT